MLEDPVSTHTNKAPTFDEIPDQKHGPVARREDTVNGSPVRVLVVPVPIELIVISHVSVTCLPICVYKAVRLV